MATSLPNIPAPCPANAYHAAHARLLLNSYRQLLGRPLIDIDLANPDLGTTLFYAGFALVSHDSSADPLFNYANRIALNLFEYSWEELIGLPSRFSAEPLNRDARQKLLAEVSAKGFIECYSGVRIAKSGKRFTIANAAVWNVCGENGAYYGQAACFKDWEILS